MSVELVFVTSNKNKVREIEDLTGNEISWLSLDDIGWTAEIPETSNTIEGNSLLKANTVWEATRKSCIAEDTGLEVEALNGEPGVFSARYAGEEADAGKNMSKLLSKLQEKENRRARFKTVITYIHDGRIEQFEGICSGVILEKQEGEGGFGYDPIFLADGASKSFGKMTIKEKQVFSHRSKAFSKFKEYLLQSLSI
jgi:XTP/dITP diphosphohydrolase